MRCVSDDAKCEWQIPRRRWNQMFFQFCLPVGRADSCRLERTSDRVNSTRGSLILGLAEGPEMSLQKTAHSEKNGFLTETVLVMLERLLLQLEAFLALHSAMAAETNLHVVIYDGVPKLSVKVPERRHQFRGANIIQ